MLEAQSEERITDVRFDPFIRISKAAMACDLSAMEISLYVAIVYYADRTGQQAYPSQETLARTAGMSSRSVKRLVPALEAKGLIRVVRESTQVNHYFILDIGTSATQSPVPVSRPATCDSQSPASATESLANDLPDSTSATESPVGTPALVTESHKPVPHRPELVTDSHQLGPESHQLVPQWPPNNRSVVVDTQVHPSQDDQQQQRDPTLVEREMFQELHIGEAIWQPWMMQEPEQVLACLLHARQFGRQPVALARSMLEQGSGAPLDRYVDEAKHKLAGEPDDAEEGEPAAFPPYKPAAKVPAAPVPEPVGLDERPGGGVLSVRDLWYAVMGQLELQLNRATFDTWLKGTTPERFEDGVLWVRPKHLYAREWLEKHLQYLLDESLARLAGVPIHVRFVGEAAAAAAGR